MIRFMSSQEAAEEGLRVVACDETERMERESGKKLGWEDFREALKAVRGNPEAEVWVRSHKSVWVK